MPGTRVILDDLGPLAEDILGSGKALRFRAGGGSMRPLLRNGDVLEVRSVDPTALKPRQIVLYRQASGRLLAHRIVAVRYRFGQKVFILQGDAQIVADEWVEPHQVLGLVSAAWREGRALPLNALPARIFGWVWTILTPWRGRLINMYRWLKGDRT